VKTNKTGISLALGQMDREIEGAGRRKESLCERSEKEEVAFG